jgi:hypothetical protein
MNVANLQLEGLLMAVAAMNRLLVDKGLVSVEDINQALERAKSRIGEAARFEDGISPSNREAICFPIRLLQLANRTEMNGNSPDFSELARSIGQNKPR